MRQISPLAPLAQRFASRTWVLWDPWICDEGVLKYVAVLWGTYARLFFVFFSLLCFLDYFCSFFFFLLLLLVFICFFFTQKPGTGVFPPLLIWHRRVHNQLETFQLPLTHPLRCKGKQLLSVARHEALGKNRSNFLGLYYAQCILGTGKALPERFSFCTSFLILVLLDQTISKLSSSAKLIWYIFALEPEDYTNHWPSWLAPMRTKHINAPVGDRK